MGKRKKNETESLPPREITRMRIRFALRFAAWTLGLAGIVLGGGWLLMRGERFLTEDARFQVPEDDPRGAEPAVTISGARHATMPALLAVFAENRGRSLYRLDPEEKRQALQRVEWVKDATVRRVWPNRVAVQIEERKPIAFLNVPGDTPEVQVPLLIDDEGYLLTPRGEIPEGLPLVAGIRASDHPEVRRERITRVRRLIEELGEAQENLDEIDVSRPEKLTVTYRLHDREYILLLGNDRFLERLERFTSGFPEWKNKLPPRAQIDLTDETRVMLRPLAAAGE